MTEQVPPIKIVTVGNEPVVWPTTKSDGSDFKLSLPPQKVWEYRLANGDLYGVVCRWDWTTADGDKRKTVLPCVYTDVGGVRAWRWSGFGNVKKSRPLLGLPELSASPNAPVLVVEGEKTRDDAAQHVPDGWVIVTWQGGAEAVKFTDFRPLAGRRVVIWPDKDPMPLLDGKPIIDNRTKKPKRPPGEVAANEVMLACLSIGAGAAVVPVYTDAMDMIPADGWDLGDPIPDGLDPAEWMMRALRSVVPPDDPSEERMNQSRVKDVDPKLEFKALGYSEGPKFHFFSAESGMIVHLSAKDVCKWEGGINTIGSVPSWWRTWAGLKDKDGEINWREIGNGLMRLCYKAGIYNGDNERGRGCWIDGGRVVMHMGQTLLIDGEKINPAKINSDYFYQLQSNFFKLKGVEPLTDEEGKHIRRLCRKIRWENPAYAEFLAGWLATAVICGAMNWRTHAWITGQHGTGKTWIMENVCKPCLGDLAINTQGESTAAGILGMMRNDARPVLFDEAEGGKNQRSQDRRDAVIGVMRASSSAGGKIYKGSANHQTVSFVVKSQFLLASIGVGLQEAADETRTVVLTLAGKGTGLHFEEMQAMALALPDNLPERLLRRQVSNVLVIRKNADTLSKILSVHLGSRRVGDQVGTLIAGDISLMTNRELTEAEAEHIVKIRLEAGYFKDFMGNNETKEDVELMRHLMSQIVKIQNSANVNIDRSMGELMAICVVEEHDEKVTQQDAESFLRRLGVSYERRTSGGQRKHGFWIAQSGARIATDVMAKSDYPQGWARVLGRHSEAQRSEGTVRFGGFKVRATWLPYDVLSGAYGVPVDKTEDQSSGDNSPPENSGELSAAE